jgi:uncharacterized damage-inducible protein DinB
MITRDTASMLARYNQWANRVIFDAVAALPAGEAEKPRTSLFKNMVHTLNHNYVIDRIFQAHLEGRPHGYGARNTAEHPPLAELRRSQDEVDAWYVSWADGIAERALDETVRFQFVGGGEGAMTRGQMLMHVVNHTTYHRGFVADLFYQVPAKPPITDLTVYLRDVNSGTEPDLVRARSRN